MQKIKYFDVKICLSSILFAKRLQILWKIYVESAEQKALYFLYKMCYNVDNK